METVISNEDRIAIAEVDYIIHHMNEKYINKIPQNILDYITILKKRNIDIYVDPKIPLMNQGLKEFTLYFIMILNLKYWCDDERRKEILTMMENNQKKFDERVSNFFEQAETIQGDGDKVHDLSKPKKVVIANNSSQVNLEDNKNKEDANKYENLESSYNIEDNTAIITSKKSSENFLTRIINKIKAIIIRK